MNKRDLKQKLLYIRDGGMITPVLEEIYDEIKKKGVGNRRNKKPYMIEVPEPLRRFQFLIAFMEWTIEKYGDPFYFSDEKFIKIIKEYKKDLKI